MSINSRFVIQTAIGLLAVGFLALLGIVLMTTWLNERAQTYFNEVIEARDTRSAAVELRNGLLAAESSQRGFLTSGNEIYLAPYDNAKTLAERQIINLGKTLERYPETGEMLRRLNVLVAEKIIEMNLTIRIKNEGRDADALALFRTNRGKSLMDEANVFLSGIIQNADQRLTTGVEEQRANAAMLRWVSLIGGIVIVMVVGAVIVTVVRYTREIAQARDAVRSANLSLEERVKVRTAELARARDRAEVLVSEVNHRVANSLSLVSSLIGLQSNAVKDRAAKDALGETQARIYAISSVHRSLYTSGDVGFVALEEYLSSLLDHLRTTMRNDGHGATLHYDIDPLKLPTDAGINLGVVVTEWVTNAFKYAYPERRGEVRVRLKKRDDGRVELAVEDDGVGRAAATPARGTGLGTRIVNAMAGAMGAEINYHDRHPGTLACLVFPLNAAA